MACASSVASLTSPGNPPNVACLAFLFTNPLITRPWRPQHQFLLQLQPHRPADPVTRCLDTPCPPPYSPVCAGNAPTHSRPPSRARGQRGQRFPVIHCDPIGHNHTIKICWGHDGASNYNDPKALWSRCWPDASNKLVIKTYKLFMGLGYSKREGKCNNKTFFLIK